MPIREITGVNDGGDLFPDNTTSTANNNNAASTVVNDSQDGGGGLSGEAGYSRTTAFVDSSVSYTQQDVDANLYKVFSFNEANHLANDNPYWSTPTPSGTTGYRFVSGR